MSKAVRLKVKKLPEEDVLKDIVRLGAHYRDGIPNQTICVVRANGRKAKGFVRGWADSEFGKQPNIGLDAALRTKLQLCKDAEYQFQLTPVGRIGHIRWYLEASDPAIRLPAWLSVISLGIAILGLALSVWSFLK